MEISGRVLWSHAYQLAIEKHNVTLLAFKELEIENSKHCNERNQVVVG